MALAMKLALATALLVGPSFPRLLGFCLLIASMWSLRLHPRKVLDMSWLDLLVAVRATWRRRDRVSLEREISQCWGSEVVVTLSVRSGFDLLLSALQLPKQSEVLFVPGITIPGMVQIVEAHGLQPVGVDPPSPMQMLPTKLGPFVTPHTRVVVISHLFGTIHKAGDLIREAQALGLLVVEDCAQSFLGSAPKRSLACAWPMGFRGHEVSDVTLSSFGNIKTLTALGGGVARVRDGKLRARMKEIEGTWPVRSRGQRLWTVFRAVVSKLFLTPMLYGLMEAVVLKLGLDFDHLIVTYVRGFAKLEYIRQQPTLELLELLLWRLQSQQVAAFEDASLQSSVSRRRRLAKIIIERLEKEGIEFVSRGDGTNAWWLLPILCDDPRQMAKEMVSRGFDATSTTTQLQRVVTAATCKREALRPSDGEDRFPECFGPFQQRNARQIIYVIKKISFQFQRVSTKGGEGFVSPQSPPLNVHPKPPPVWSGGLHGPRAVPAPHAHLARGLRHPSNKNKKGKGTPVGAPIQVEHAVGVIWLKLALQPGFRLRFEAMGHSWRTQIPNPPRLQARYPCPAFSVALKRDAIFVASSRISQVPPGQLSLHVSHVYKCPPSRSQNLNLQLLYPFDREAPTPSTGKQPFEPQRVIRSP